ncbi:flagellar brake protein [Cupriavidus necator]|uniref:flagellar brake protein n=1 Tax=Cupriavidus necator TaxID=106590 RepID=UPI0039C2030A
MNSQPAIISIWGATMTRTHPHPQSLASQVGLVLQDLAWLNCEVIVRVRGGYAITTKLLKVDSPNKTFIFDGCRTDAEREILLASGQLGFSAILRGAETAFVVEDPQVVYFQGRRACAAAFPRRFRYDERRQHPRAPVPASLSLNCESPLEDGERLRLKIVDVSQAGVGLRSEESDIRRLPMGTVLRGCKLDLGKQSLLDITLQVAGYGLQWQGQSVIHTIGCAFVSLTLSQQTILQRLVYQIELAGRE